MTAGACFIDGTCVPCWDRNRWDGHSGRAHPSSALTSLRFRACFYGRGLVAGTTHGLHTDGAAKTDEEASGDEHGRDRKRGGG